MTAFLLIRHGETAWHLPTAKGAKGWGVEMAPLTEKGIRQVKRIIPDVRDWSPELLVSSPTSRTLHTCALLSKELGVPFEVEFDLHEWIPDNGLRWESYDEVLEAQDEMKRLGGEWPEGETRNWESLSQVNKRVSEVLKRYKTWAKVAVICHEVVIRSLTGQDLSFTESIEYIPFTQLAG